ncbi:Uncharacterised protein [Salmonella enterica subsp. enterica serovar Bovismorbificans]|uniref:Uncharacterized protein n=1 Tax=Salmonella enterica subsp. enterica serovar Bovismorbificans TaxID=58097 RepID=A0A655E4G2_SALET|nr:Uncharacterised protein [Salmonella enterica subsp. enterica serovar Bovismorbificans]CNV16291.1 Uncharacterised protein [Salmonella enterica subsp. enterica serovar Bovismorbificans]
MHVLHPFAPSASSNARLRLALVHKIARSGVKGRLAISGQAMTPKTAFQAGVTGRTGPLNPPANKLRIIR